MPRLLAMFLVPCRHCPARLLRRRTSQNQLGRFPVRLLAREMRGVRPGSMKRNLHPLSLNLRASVQQNSLHNILECRRNCRQEKSDGISTTLHELDLGGFRSDSSLPHRLAASNSLMICYGATDAELLAAPGKQQSPEPQAPSPAQRDRLGQLMKLSYGAPSFATQSISLLIAVYAADYYVLLVRHMKRIYAWVCRVSLHEAVAEGIAYFSETLTDPRNRSRRNGKGGGREARVDSTWRRCPQEGGSRRAVKALTCWAACRGPASRCCRSSQPGLGALT